LDKLEKAEEVLKHGERSEKKKRAGLLEWLRG